MKDISPPEPEPKPTPEEKAREGGQIDFGWLQMKEDVMEVTNELEVIREPDERSFENRTYQIGQKHYFAVINGSSEDLVYPFCSIEFPSRSKHLQTENPATGLRTIKSDLRGMSGRLTELRDLSLSKMEISSILPRVLKPSQLVRFFVRFDFPETTASYNLQMRLKAVGISEITKDLTLKVKAL